MTTLYSYSFLYNRLSFFSNFNLPEFVYFFSLKIINYFYLLHLLHQQRVSNHHETWKLPSSPIHKSPSHGHHQSVLILMKPKSLSSTTITRRNWTTQQHLELIQNTLWLDFHREHHTSFKFNLLKEIPSVQLLKLVSELVRILLIHFW